MDYNIGKFNFDFDEIIKYQIDILNESLEYLGELSIFENTTFEVNKESAGTFYLRISIVYTKRITLPIDIHLNGDGMRLDVFHLSESFEWSKKELRSERNDIIIFFQQLFTSYILIESYGSPNSKTRMYLFNENGDLLKKYGLRGFIQSYSGWNYDKKLFFPIYPQN